MKQYLIKYDTLFEKGIIKVVDIEYDFSEYSSKNYIKNFIKQYKEMEITNVSIWEVDFETLTIKLIAKE